MDTGVTSYEDFAYIEGATVRMITRDEEDGKGDATCVLTTGLKNNRLYEEEVFGGVSSGSLEEGLEVLHLLGRAGKERHALVHLVRFQVQHPPPPRAVAVQVECESKF